MSDKLIKVIYLPGILLLISSCFLSYGCAHKANRTDEDMLKYGIKLAKADYWHEAAFHWRRILDKDPDNVAALNNLAIAAESEGYPREAYAALKKALSLRPDSREIKKNLIALEKRFRSETASEKEKTNEE